MSSMTSGAPKEFHTWTKEEACDWLKRIGLTELLDVFEANHIDGQQLVEMLSYARHDFERLGIASVTLRRNLGTAINDLVSENKSSPARPRVDTSAVRREGLVGGPGSGGSPSPVTKKRVMFQSMRHVSDTNVLGMMSSKASSLYSSDTLSPPSMPPRMADGADAKPKPVGEEKSTSGFEGGELEDDSDDVQEDAAVPTANRRQRFKARSHTLFMARPEGDEPSSAADSDQEASLSRAAQPSGSMSPGAESQRYKRSLLRRMTIAPGEFRDIQLPTSGKGDGDSANRSASGLPETSYRPLNKKSTWNRPVEPDPQFHDVMNRLRNLEETQEEEDRQRVKQWLTESVMNPKVRSVTDRIRKNFLSPEEKRRVAQLEKEKEAQELDDFLEIRRQEEEMMKEEEKLIEEAEKEMLKTPPAKQPTSAAAESGRRGSGDGAISLEGL